MSQWSESAPKWRSASGGLCYENICNSKNCVAFGKQVIINMGYGSFKLGIPNDKIRCPVCQAKLQNLPKTCAFNRCKWKYDGVKMENGDTKEVTSDWKTVFDEYHKFEEAETANWIEIVLSAKKLHE